MKALLQVGALPKTINRSALIDTFAMGYICGEKTWLKEIHRILPGSYLRYDAGEKTFQEFNYFELKKCPEVKDALPSHQELKQKFNTAVDRIFKTTENNGYRQLMTLSGGLDSRAVAATAANLGYSNVLAMNFAESGTGDAIYAGKLAHSLGFYYLYESYDGGNWLVDFFDKSMLAGEGMYHYLDIARMIFSLRNINTEEFGTVHTGTLGDTLMGSHIKQADLERDQMPFKLGELMAAVRNRLGFGNPRGFNHLVENFGNEE
ncbi:MAG: asparagine synthase-related protein, partial [Calditrichota bacterium]